jgi:hypothetical protein
MDVTAIVQSIDAEIMRLEKIRALLTEQTAPLEPGFAPSEPARKRKRVSEEGRARMAAAQKARWAKLKGK